MCELNLAATIRRDLCRIASPMSRSTLAICVKDSVAMLAASPNLEIKVSPVKQFNPCLMIID